MSLSSKSDQHFQMRYQGYVFGVAINLSWLVMVTLALIVHLRMKMFKLVSDVGTDHFPYQ